MDAIERSARKITYTLLLAQSLASAGTIAAATVNSIVGAKLAGTGWAGLPSAVYLLGGAFSAFAWGLIMDVIGRRNGLVFGLGIGIAGAGLAFWAIPEQNLLIFLGGSLLMGAANAAVVLGRFAAAEVSPPQQRGQALSTVVLGGTFGAIFGPLLVGPSGQWALSLGVDELAGPYAVTALLFAAALLVEFTGLRPDPLDLGRQVAERYPEATPTGGLMRPLMQIMRQPAVILAMLAMVLGQMVMVMVMVITSLHMRGHDHSLNHISFVISSHTFGMYAFSVFSGRLSDKWGRARVILAGALLLIAACLTAPLSPDLIPLAVSLFLLGLGWNLCFVGGSALLADQLSPAERSRTQGFNDLLVGLASALGSLGSGVVFNIYGYAVMGLAGAALSLLPLAAGTIWLNRQRQQELVGKVS